MKMPRLGTLATKIGNQSETSAPITMLVNITAINLESYINGV